MSRMPLVFDIKRGSLDDGPGIRSVVFLKGCPLACLWCHNPEAYDVGQAIFFDTAKCIGCGSCKTACSTHAIGVSEESFINRSLCERCGDCTNVCPTNALLQVGKFYEKQELLSILFQDNIYYRQSGGGVTFSGGEPMLFTDYVGSLAKELVAAGISVAIETCGYFDWDLVAKSVLPYVDNVLFDIKIFDSIMHKQFTGVDNHLILENLRRMAAMPNLQITPRTPLIPGITDTPQNLEAIQGFLAGLHLEEKHQLLAYNDGGIKKREKLGMLN